MHYCKHISKTCTTNRTVVGFLFSFKGVLHLRAAGRVGRFLHTALLSCAPQHQCLIRGKLAAVTDRLVDLCIDLRDPWAAPSSSPSGKSYLVSRCKPALIMRGKPRRDAAPPSFITAGSEVSRSAICQVVLTSRARSLVLCSLKETINQTAV